MSKAILIDTTKCIGCRSCQVSCKEWNDLPGEKTAVPRAGLGLQNPVTVSSKTLTLVTYHEVAEENAPGGLKYVFAKRQCMHCDDPACASACPVAALRKTPEGPVIYDSGKCIGCRYCVWACPFGVPTVEWDSLAPEIRKCTFCYDRITQPAPQQRNGKALTPQETARFLSTEAVPACVKQCPAGALAYGERDALLGEAKRRIQAAPGKYVDHVYGEHEAGGTSALYLASVPFKQLGFPQVHPESYPGFGHLKYLPVPTQSYMQVSAAARSAVAPSVLGLGALLGGTHVLYQRRQAVAQANPQAAGTFGALAAAKTKPKRVERKEPARHAEFAASACDVRSRASVFLMALAAFGGLSLLARFFLGLGGSTNLSDTYGWGLWIAFLLIRIAISAGSFVGAGLIYVSRRRDLYPIGRTAVLVGSLSYASVLVTLLADVGRPWNFWQLLLRAPRHSAMYEVSWCITLYFIVLLVEFLPVPIERWGWARAAELWRRFSPAFVVAILTLFVFLMSRSLVYAVLALALFGVLAVRVRTREGEEAAPTMLAIAGVVFATMHQSSLGALFLLMPDKMDALWWSPLLPAHYLFSALAAGTALLISIQIWIAKGYRRPLEIKQLAALGNLAFAFLLIYEAGRMADVIFRGQLPRVLSGSSGALFLVEMIPFGVLPLVLLGSKAIRQRPAPLNLAALLAVTGVVLNRTNAVFFAMNLKGPMPQIAPTGYFPSVWEWGLSIGLVAGTILVFRWAAQAMPVLPSPEARPVWPSN
jgi:formate dehydrogenase iron-sulfur subunit